MAESLFSGCYGLRCDSMDVEMQHVEGNVIEDKIDGVKELCYSANSGIVDVGGVII